jgi:hypothetical protein
LSKKEDFYIRFPRVLAGADESKSTDHPPLAIAVSGRGYAWHSPSMTYSTAYCAKDLVQYFEGKTIWHSRSVMNITLHYAVITALVLRPGPVQRSFRFEDHGALPATADG